jgi:hypothetical protein
VIGEGRNGNDLEERGHGLINASSLCLTGEDRGKTTKISVTIADLRLGYEYSVISVP